MVATAPETPETIDIQKCIHPWEESRFWLGVCVTIPIIVIFIFATGWVAIFAILGVILAAWFATQIFKAHLLGSAAEVSEDNFPEIHQLLVQVCKQLNYPEKVEVYVYQDGDVNAFLVRLFSTRLIMLPHELVVGMSDDQTRTELIWILARSVGHLKAKHLRLWLLRILIEGFENLLFLNLFLYPWERATHYTGDRIGLAACGDLGAALKAINKLMLGNALSGKTTLLGALKQRRRLSGTFFGWLAQSLSSHPHMTYRIASLISWSKTYNPPAYECFIQTQANRDQIESLIQMSTSVL